jgi:hypothetical protein
MYEESGIGNYHGEEVTTLTGLFVVGKEIILPTNKPNKSNHTTVNTVVFSDLKTNNQHRRAILMYHKCKSKQKVNMDENTKDQ